MKAYELWEKTITKFGKEDKGEVGKAIRQVWKKGLTPEILITPRINIKELIKEMEK